MNLRTLCMSAVARLRAALDEPFPRWADTLADDAWGTTDLHQRVAPDLRRFVGGVQAALDAIQTGATAAATAYGSEQYVPAERQRRAAEALNTARAAFDQQLSAASSALDAVTAAVRAAGLPQRPGPADAAQEGALANLRTDLRMVLDPTPAGQLAERIVELTADAAGRGDALTVWLLAGSPWAANYLRSRGEDGMTGWLTANVGQALAPTGSKQVRQALQTAPLLEDGPNAARRLVDVYLPATAQEEFTDAAAMAA